MSISKRKLRSRLMIVIISILSCFAVMSVGVYAATKHFSVTVANEVSLELAQVDGHLWAKRLGNVVYNGDEHTDEALSNQKSATIDEFLKVYDYLDKENTQYAANLAEIEKRVNIEETKDNVDENGNLKIMYVFKFQLVASAARDVVATLTETSTEFKTGDERADYVKLNYRYMFSSTEPNWDENNTLGTQMTFTNSVSEIYIDTTTAIETPTSQYQKVDPLNANTYTLFILAELSVPTTNSLDSAFTLGVQDDYFWTFSLKFSHPE